MLRDVLEVLREHRVHDVVAEVGLLDLGQSGRVLLVLGHEVGVPVDSAVVLAPGGVVPLDSEPNLACGVSRAALVDQLACKSDRAQMAANLYAAAQTLVRVGGLQVLGALARGTRWGVLRHGFKTKLQI